VNHNLTVNVGELGSIVTALLISFFEGRLLLRWIVTNISFARGTLLCRKTRITYGNQLVISGLYVYPP
jgi:hypothetical protein